MKKTFQIEGMHCSSCVMLLEDIEEDLAGVRTAEASYHKGTLIVEWDENMVSEADINAAVESKGYQLRQ